MDGGSGGGGGGGEVAVTILRVHCWRVGERVEWLGGRERERERERWLVFEKSEGESGGATVGERERARERAK